MREDITKQIDDLNEDLKVRQESIDLLKGRLKSQITNFKETIAKVLDSNTSLAEKIHTQRYESQLSVMLFIGRGVKIAQHRFSRWKFVTKYLMIFSHCVI